MKKFAYLLMGAGFDPQKHKAEFVTGGSLTAIATARDFEEAKATALRLWREGYGVIEVCGAFGKERAAALAALCNNEVGIAYVVHDPAQEPLFQAFFS